MKILLNTQLRQENITAQKTKFSIKNFFSVLRIWSHLVKRFLIENFIFYAVRIGIYLLKMLVL